MVNTRGLPRGYNNRKDCNRVICHRTRLHPLARNFLWGVRRVTGLLLHFDSLDLRINSQTLVTNLRNKGENKTKGLSIPLNDRQRRVRVSLLPNEKNFINFNTPIILRPNRNNRNVTKGVRHPTLNFRNNRSGTRHVITRNTTFRLRRRNFRRRTSGTRPLIRLNTTYLHRSVLVPRALRSNVGVMNLAVFLVRFMMSNGVPNGLLILRVLNDRLLTSYGTRLLIVLRSLKGILPNAKHCRNRAIRDNLSLMGVFKASVRVTSSTTTSAIFRHVNLPYFVA